DTFYQFPLYFGLISALFSFIGIIFTLSHASLSQSGVGLLFIGAITGLVTIFISISLLSSLTKEEDKINKISIALTGAFVSIAPFIALLIMVF
ncbi:MAG: hypothetical protein AB1489_34490, partial [Acidobacteriota bacterium]